MVTKVTIEIETRNDAFAIDPAHEVCRILRSIEDRIHHDGDATDVPVVLTITDSSGAEWVRTAWRCGTSTVT